MQYSIIHPLTGTTSSGGGGSGGREPKCFSSFIRCVRFMMTRVSWSCRLTQSLLVRLIQTRKKLQMGLCRAANDHVVCISATLMQVSKFQQTNNPQTEATVKVFNLKSRKREKKKTKQNTRNKLTFHCLHQIGHVSGVMICILNYSPSHGFIKSNRSTCSHCQWYVCVLVNL